MATSARFTRRGCGKPATRRRPRSTPSLCILPGVGARAQTVGNRPVGRSLSRRRPGPRLRQRRFLVSVRRDSPAAVGDPPATLGTPQWRQKSNQCLNFGHPLPDDLVPARQEWRATWPAGCSSECLRDPQDTQGHQPRHGPVGDPHTPGTARRPGQALRGGRRVRGRQHRGNAARPPCFRPACPGHVVASAIAGVLWSAVSPTGALTYLAAWMVLGIGRMVEAVSTFRWGMRAPVRALAACQEAEAGEAPPNHCRRRLMLNPGLEGWPHPYQVAPGEPSTSTDQCCASVISIEVRRLPPLFALVGVSRLCQAVTRGLDRRDSSRLPRTPV
jgi:hypothetical protein